MDKRELMPATICAALVKAQRAISPVARDAEGQVGKRRYAYASSEAIFAEARAALNGAGLAAMPAAWQVTVDDGVGRMHVRYLLVAESGESWETGEVSTPIFVEHGRPVDKAEAAALTFNSGYFLRGLLLIPRVDPSDEVDGRDDSAHRTERKTPAPSQASRKPRGSSSGGDIEIKFGRAKGQRIADADANDLTWYRSKMDPNDPKWGRLNQEVIEAIDAELQARETGEGPPPGAAVPHEDDGFGARIAGDEPPLDAYDMDDLPF